MPAAGRLPDSPVHADVPLQAAALLSLLQERAPDLRDLKQVARFGRAAGIGGTCRPVCSRAARPGAVALLIVKANMPLVSWGEAQSSFKHQGT